MTDSNEQIANFRKVLVFLEAQRRSLSIAGAGDEFLAAFSSVLRFLKELPKSQILELTGAKSAQTKNRQARLVGDFQMTSLSLDEIERIATDIKTPRKILEEIAVSRFHVPKGSMRSFQNIEMLREKILIRIQNERTHKVIGEIARQNRR